MLLYFSFRGEHLCVSVLKTGPLMPFWVTLLLPPLGNKVFCFLFKDEVSRRAFKASLSVLGISFSVSCLLLKYVGSSV